MSGPAAGVAAGVAWAERYLRLLGLPREAPGLEALGRLTRAQILTVPFENSHAICQALFPLRAFGTAEPMFNKPHETHN